MVDGVQARHASSVAIESNCPGYGRFPCLSYKIRTEPEKGMCSHAWLDRYTPNRTALVPTFQNESFAKRP
jgi:hypothetical protein